MKIIGAGYGRTGTKSLQIALEKLGFGKCYHMEELLRNPEGVNHWKDAMEGKEVMWDELFIGYESIVDFPGSMYYKELSEYYPDSKVILSLRDPERWYKSAYETIFGFDPGISFKMKMRLQSIFNKKARNLIKVFQLNDKSIWGKYFEGKFKDKDYAIQKFRQHIEEVKKEIPSERLLVHEAKEGWEPLCKFLNKEIPNKPYPRRNKGEDFAQWAKSIVVESLKGQ